MIYNDAYSAFAGDRHPALLGSRVRDGWSEIADFNDHVMKVGLAGGTLSYKDQELSLNRHGIPELVWMDLDYSPVIGDRRRASGRSRHCGRDHCARISRAPPCRRAGAAAERYR